MGFDLTSIWSAVQGGKDAALLIGTGALAALGGQQVVVRYFFNHASGVVKIENNAENIRDISEKHKTLNEVMKDKRIGSIIYADVRSSHIFIRKEDGETDALMLPLHMEGFRLNFDRIKQHLAAPHEFFEQAKHPQDISQIDKKTLKEFRSARRWENPSFLRRTLGRVLGGYEQKIHNVSDSLLSNVQTLAADNTEDIALFGTCHAALKWTDDAGRAHIVAMPFNSHEAKMMEDMSKGKNMNGKGLSAQAIISAISHCSEDFCTRCHFVPRKNERDISPAHS